MVSEEQKIIQAIERMFTEGTNQFYIEQQYKLALLKMLGRISEKLGDNP